MKVRNSKATRVASIARVLPIVLIFALVTTAGAARAQSCPSTQHALTFANNCGYPVWLAELGTSDVVPGNWEIAASCTTNSQCTSGQTCNKATSQCSCATNQDCAGGTCQSGLCANSQTLCMPIGWNGRFWPRTQCDIVSCATSNDCSSPYNTCFNGQCVYSGCTSNLDCQNQGAPYLNNPNDQCTGGKCFVADNGPLPGNGGLCQTGDCNGHLDCGAAGLTANGTTLFEATFTTESDQDNYDVSLVSGYNVPASVTLPGEGTACAVDGVPLTSAGGCVHDLNKTCPSLLQVTVPSTNGGACETNGQCPAASSCNPTTGTCVVACLHPGAACLAANPPSALNCGSNNNLYTCNSPNESCNKSAAVCFTDKVVGNNDCPAGSTCDTTVGDFGNNPGMPVGDGVCNPAVGLPAAACNGTTGSLGLDCSSVAPFPQAAGYTCNTLEKESTELPVGVCLPPTSGANSCCGPANANWMAAAMTAGGGTISYASTFKAACPVAYSFQYDDPTSNPFCTNSSSSLLNYTVTFCPTPVTLKHHRHHHRQKHDHERAEVAETARN